MKYEGLTRSYPNTTDMTSEANFGWRFMTLSAGILALVSVAGAESVGVLVPQFPNAKQAGHVQYTGVARVRASAAIAVMAKVSSTNVGKSKTAATTEVSHGIAVTAAGADLDLHDVLLSLNAYKI